MVIDAESFVASSNGAMAIIAGDEAATIPRRANQTTAAADQLWYHFE